MKKNLCYILCLYSLISIMLCACGNSKHSVDMSTAGGDSTFISETNLTNSSNSPESENPENGETWDMIPMVMVNDDLYLATGYEKKIEKRRDTFDGEITSEVDGSQQPTVNDQSNFGTGYGYQYGTTEGILEIYMNDTWQVFATEKVIASATLILEEPSADQPDTD